MLYFHRMKKNDIENRTQEGVFLWVKPVVTCAIVSLMEIVVAVVVGLVLELIC